MAPESFLGIHSRATDVYSAGIVLFELFTGRHPFRVVLSASASASEVASIVRESRSQIVPKVTDFCPELSERWDALFHSALAHDYEERPRTAYDLLTQFLAASGPDVPPCEPRSNDVSVMVREAKQLAEQADTLNDAIDILERACRFDAKVRDRYSEMLSLWKRGIVL